MFSKRLQVKRVRRYPTPAYPVLNAGEVIFLPKERDLGRMVRDLAKPVLPLVAATAMLTHRAEASSAGGPPRPTAVPADVLREADRPIEARVQDPADADSPYRIRKFSDTEIKSLLSELKIGPPSTANVRGIAKASPVVLTETQGREILQRFFRKNGLRFRSDVDFRKDDVEFSIDGFDEKKKVGFEFWPVSGEKDLSGEETARLEQGLKGAHVLLVKGKRDQYNGLQVVLRLQKEAESFLRRLYEQDAIGRGKEIKGHIRDLSAGDEKARAAGSEALREIGGEAVWFLRAAVRELKDMEKYAVDRDEMRAQRGRLEDLVQSIFEEKIEPLLEQLDDPALERREAAADLLIDMGPGIRGFVEAWREEAGREDNREVAQWCDKILKAFGD